MTTDSEPARSTSEPIRSALEARIGRLLTPSGIIMALMSVVYLYMVIDAPIDRTQGVIQKILYVHPPLAYLAYLLHRFVLYPLNRALTRRDVALAIEQRFPELQEKLISAIQLGKGLAPSPDDTTRESIRRHLMPVS